MPQSVEKTLDYASLFLEPEYKEMLSAKSKLENMPEADKVKEIADWTKSWEYREKNRKTKSTHSGQHCFPVRIAVLIRFASCGCWSWWYQ